MHAEKRRTGSAAHLRLFGERIALHRGQPIAILFDRAMCGGIRKGIVLKEKLNDSVAVALMAFSLRGLA